MVCIDIFKTEAEEQRELEYMRRKVAEYRERVKDDVRDFDPLEEAAKP